ncbi:MAG: glycosyltransferase family 4 protein [Bacteroidales bacterium]|nr:glycosyltransferase family 4 protein [Bacteroidales bacterium]HPD96454.1 glycosyltransferase family 4 protein [Tenuifilaceae bacterium]
MKKVLFIVQLPPPIHGASVMNQTVLKLIGNDSRFVCRYISLNFIRKLSDLETITLRKVFRAITIEFELIFKLITFNPKVVYFSMVPHGIVLVRDGLYLATIKLLSPKSKKIIHLHRSGLEAFTKKRHVSWVIRLLLRKCEIVHLTPKLLKNEIVPLNIPKTKLHVVPNFLDDPAICSSSGKKANTKLLFLSNLLTQKGYLNLVEAMAIVIKDFPNIKLTIAGETPREKNIFELKKRISNLALENYIDVVGKIEGIHKNQLYAESDILILPSEMEYFPLVILEAMAAKTVVVSTGRENLNETFTHLYNIVFLENNSPSEIAWWLIALLNNKPLQNFIANNGYSRFLEIQEEGKQKIKELFA